MKPFRDSSKMTFSLGSERWAIMIWATSPFFISAISSSVKPIRAMQPTEEQNEYGYFLVVSGPKEIVSGILSKVSSGTTIFAAATAG